MKIKLLIVSVTLLILNGCTIGYATKIVDIPKNYRVVSISSERELKADLLEMYDFNILYNQPLPESCRGVVKVGDYMPFIEETTTILANGMEIKKLKNLSTSGDCVKASPDEMKSGFDS